MLLKKLAGEGVPEVTHWPNDKEPLLTTSIINGRFISFKTTVQG